VSVKVRASVEGAEESFHWMVKLLKPDPPSGRDIARLMKVFDREISIYEVSVNSEP
jgi:hypothetical protein